MINSQLLKISIFQFKKNLNFQRMIQLISMIDPKLMITSWNQTLQILMNLDKNSSYLNQNNQVQITMKEQHLMKLILNYYQTQNKVNSMVLLILIHNSNLIKREMTILSQRILCLKKLNLKLRALNKFLQQKVNLMSLLIKILKIMDLPLILSLKIKVIRMTLCSK